ncbi:MAG: Gfo/Idh/MocA family oxidoreductase [Ferruginibacter sp.]|nr:Gfo/Idh/MocA family oxidoreductase [Ferruginibacter sp.]
MLRFALIGCGAIGKRHADIIAARHHLVAVCDIVPEKAAAFGLKYHAAAYDKLQMLLESETWVDVVVIATPNGCHAQQTIAALQSGKNVLCEKPMAIKSTDAQQMVKVANETGKKLWIVKQNRYNPPVAQVRGWLEEGKLGKLIGFQLNGFWNRPDAYYYNSWHGSADLDGGILFTQFSHFIDILCWLVGDIEEVRGFASNIMHPNSMAFEDTGAVAIKMKNGCIGSVNFTVNSFGKNMEGSITLFGEKGTVKIGGAYLNELSYVNIDGIDFVDAQIFTPENDYGNYKGSMSNHPRVYNHVEDVLLKNAPIFPSLADSVKTVEMIEQIYAAIR